VAVARTTTIDPKRNAIATAIFARLPSNRAIFSPNLQINAQPVVVPGYPYLGKSVLFLQSS